MAEAAQQVSRRPTVVLTPQQATVHQRVLVEGASRAEVAREMRLSRQRIQQLVDVVRERLAEVGCDDPVIEVVGRREVTKEVRAFTEAGACLGVDVPALRALTDRAMNKVPDAEELEGLDDKALVKALDGKIELTLRYIDAAVLAKSTSSQLATMFDKLVQARQLLKGEATSIVRWEDRRKIEEVADLLRQEFERRQKIVDVTPEAVDA